MVFDTRKNGDILVFDIRGAINVTNVQGLKEELRSCVNGGRLRVIINMQDVNYVDSSGMGALINARNDLRNQGGNLILINLNANVRENMKLSGLQDFFAVREDENAAVQSLQSSRE